MSQGPPREGHLPPPYGAPQFQPPTGYPPNGYPQAGYPATGYPSSPPGPPPWSPAASAVWPPAPPPYRPAPGVAAEPAPRPAVITLACTLAVTASLQWICGLSLLWVTAVTATSTFDQLGDNGAVFHILRRFQYRMLDGLAVPLYLFPLASLVTGFLLLHRRPWTRVAHTVVGAAALAWAAWWLREDLLWWFGGGWYVVVACLVLWTRSATAWYHRRAPSAIAEARS